MSEKEIRMPFSEYESLVAQANDARNALKDGKIAVEVKKLEYGLRYSTKHKYYTNEEAVAELRDIIKTVEKSYEELYKESSKNSDIVYRIKCKLQSNLLLRCIFKLFKLKIK